MIPDKSGTRHFAPWKQRVEQVSTKAKSDLQPGLEGAREALAPKIPKVTKLTIYSLFPFAPPNIRDHSDRARAETLEKLSRFHDFPILGEFTISNASEANRWTDFLRDQVLPGGFSACDPMPRHGFRFSTPKGDVDVLMCYQCDQLAIFGAGELNYKFNPVFSSATMGLLNELLDKKKIERDEPKKSNG